MLFSQIYTGCQSVRSAQMHKRPDKVTKRIDNKQQKNDEVSRAELRKKHYEKQAESTQKRMDYNAKKAAEWRDRYLKSGRAGILEQIRHWIAYWMARFRQPEKGLFK